MTTIIDIYIIINPSARIDADTRNSTVDSTTTATVTAIATATAVPVYVSAPLL